jgi:hypothetical protein
MLVLQVQVEFATMDQKEDLLFLKQLALPGHVPLDLNVDDQMLKSVDL